LIGSSRVAKDLPDTTDYSIALVPSVADMNRSAEDTTISRFHIGEAIKIHWQAPVTHSKRDWIGVRIFSRSLLRCQFCLTHLLGSSSDLPA
jgi:hypothetical protein